MQLPEATNYQQPPTGTHSAICIGFYDLGTHPNEYQGVTSMKHQVFIRWELPEEQTDDGRPFTIGQFYTWSMSENAKLRAHLEAWRNKPFEKADFGKGGFDTRKLLGVPLHPGRDGVREGQGPRDLGRPQDEGAGAALSRERADLRCADPRCL